LVKNPIMVFLHRELGTTKDKDKFVNQYRWAVCWRRVLLVEAGGALVQMHFAGAGGATYHRQKKTSIL
jgi:hypothetical protein